MYSYIRGIENIYTGKYKFTYLPIRTESEPTLCRGNFFVGIRYSKEAMMRIRPKGNTTGYTRNVNIIKENQHPRNRMMREGGGGGV